MATEIKLKKSSVSGRIPSTSDLSFGEIAINYADGIIYFKSSSDEVKSISANAIGVDSAATLGLIDSAYIQARQTSSESLDSAAVIALVGDGTFRGLRTYSYTASSGSTTFSGADNNGNSLVYSAASVIVTVNGVILRETDYTATNGTSVILNTAADSDDEVTIFNIIAGATIDSAHVAIEAKNAIDSAYIVARNGFDNLRESSGTLIVSGNILPSADSTYSIGSESKKFKDIFLSGGTVYIDNLGLSADPVTQKITIGQLDSIGVLNSIGVIATVDSTQVGTIVDSAYLADRLADFTTDAELAAFGYSTFDSTNATGLIDSAYIQARQTAQDFAYSSLTGTPNILDSTNVSNIVTGFGYTTFDSTAAISLITANAIDSSVALELLLDSIETINLIDSDYVQARQDFAYSSLTNPPNVLDSTNVTSVIQAVVTSDYVQAREAAQDFAYSSLTGKPNILDSTDVTNHITASDLDMGGNKVLFGNLYDSVGALPSASTYHGMFAHVHATGAGYFAHAGNWVQLANNSDISTYGNSDVTSLVDSAYVQARTTAGTDSTATIALIEATVDSAYVALREANADGGSGLDSAAITNLVDSAYVQARQTSGGGGGGLDSAAVLNLVPEGTARGLFAYYYTADSGDTTFSGADTNGTTLSYSEGSIAVYLNGLLLRDIDYTATNGTSVVLGEAADSGDEITILKTNVSAGDSAVISSIVDSTYISSIVDSAYISARSSAGTDSATVITIIENTADSAYIQARQTSYNTSNFTDSAFVTGLPVSTFTNDANYLDSTTVTGVISASYIQSNQTSYNTSNFTDSAFVTGLSVSTFTNDANYSTFDSTSASGMLSSYAPLASPALTGTPTAPTASAATNSTQIATTAYVTTAVNNLIDGAPDTLNTLNEIAAALNDDDSAYATLVTLIGQRLDSTAATGIIDSAYVQLRQDFAYSSLTGAPTNVSSFTNDANYLDSTTVTGVISASYIQSNQTTYTNVSEFVNDANYLDSTTVQGVIDASYVQSNQITYNTSDFTDSAFVTGLPVSTFTNDANYLDSTTVTGVISASYIQSNQTTYDFLDSAETIALIDSDYVQLRQDFAYASLTGTPTIPALGTDFVDSAETNTLIDARVTNTFLRGLIDDSTLTIDGNGTDGGVTIQDGGITIRTGTGSVAYVDLYCETSNAHRTRLKSAAHSDYSGNVDVTLPTSTGTLALTSDDITGNAATATALATGRTIDVTGVTATGQSFDGTGDISIEVTAVPTSLLTGTIDSALLPDGTFGGGSGGTDSATVISLITSTVDSAYVALREADAGVGSGGLDSAAVTNLVDSAYVQARQTSSGSGGGLDSAAVLSIFEDTSTRGIYAYYYTADSGDTTFSGIDSDGNTLAYKAGSIAVYLNGVLLRSSDYTATNGTSVVLNESLATDDEVTIIKSVAGGSVTTNNFSYTVASDGDTVFSGIDNNNNTLSYNIGNTQVFRNGILLVDSDDYTATNGTSITLTNNTVSGDNISITSFTGTINGLSEAAAINLIDSAYVLARAGDAGLDSSAVTNLVDSAYVQARVDENKYLQLNQIGTLEVTTGTARWVSPRNINISTVKAIVGTAPAGSSLITTLNKNGSAIDTLTISAGSDSDTNTGLSLAVNQSDYLTVNITQIGSTTAGSDLNVIITYVEE